MFVCQWRGTGQNPPGATHHETRADAERVAARKRKAIGWQPGMPVPVVVFWSAGLAQVAPERAETGLGATQGVKWHPNPIECNSGPQIGDSA